MNDEVFGWTEIQAEGIDPDSRNVALVREELGCPL